MGLERGSQTKCNLRRGRGRSEGTQDRHTRHTDTRLAVVHDGGGSGGGCDGRTNLATEARHESPSSLLFIVSASHARETDIAWGFAQ